MVVVSENGAKFVSRDILLRGVDYGVQQTHLERVLVVLTVVVMELKPANAKRLRQKGQDFAQNIGLVCPTWHL